MSGESTDGSPPGLSAPSTLEASHLKAQLGCERVIVSYGIHSLIQSQRLGVWRVLVKDGAGGPGRPRHHPPAHIHFQGLGQVFPLTALGSGTVAGTGLQVEDGEEGTGQREKGPQWDHLLPLSSSHRMAAGRGHSRALSGWRQAQCSLRNSAVTAIE